MASCPVKTCPLGGSSAGGTGIPSRSLSYEIRGCVVERPRSDANLRVRTHGAPGGASAVQLRKLRKHLKQLDAVSDGISRAVLPHGVQKVGGSNPLAPTNSLPPQSPRRTRVPSVRGLRPSQVRTWTSPLTERPTERRMRRDGSDSATSAMTLPGPVPPLGQRTEVPASPRQDGVRLGCAARAGTRTLSRAPAH